jgi:UDP:flavonoid glycosyltransferase YjiC (YdhE family)
MRVLVTTAPGAGHLFPLVPLAWALRSAGHELLLATAGAGVELGPAAGLPTVDAAPGMDMGDVVRGLGARPGFTGKAVPDARAHAVALFTAVGRRLLDGIRRAADLWQPDVVLHEGMDGAGPVVAAERGLPRVEHSISPADQAGVMGALIQQGLTDAAHVPAVATVGIAPPSMASAPDPGWTIRTVPYNGGAVVPPSVLAAPERPRVLVTMGTVAPRTGGTGAIRGALVEALAAEPVEVLVALGLDPAELGPLPASVQAHRWVPLTAALPRCSAIVHHCGPGRRCPRSPRGSRRSSCRRARTSSSTRMRWCGAGARFAARPSRTSCGPPSAARCPESSRPPPRTSDGRSAPCRHRRPSPRSSVRSSAHGEQAHPPRRYHYGIRAQASRRARRKRHAECSY